MKKLISFQNFDFYFQIIENVLLNSFESRGKSLYVHRSCKFWIVCFVCGTAYLIRPAESNDPACGYLTMASGH